MTNSDNIKFTVSPGKCVLLLFLTAVAGLCVAGILGAMLISMASPARALAMTRISAVIQDILMLIIPAVATAMIVTRRPARLLALDSSPTIEFYLVAVITLLVATPLMNLVVSLNAGIQLPEPFDHIMRQMEESAAATIDFMLGPHNPGNLAMSLLIVGVLAGLCEEIFFRGGLQRLLSTGSMSGIAAVWITALVFSAIHLQFFGFVPRLLLGAYLGYLVLWSGSVWPAVCVHTVNNSIYVILMYFTGSGEMTVGGSTTGTGIYVVLSILLTSAGLYLLKRISAARPGTTTNLK